MNGDDYQKKDAHIDYSSNMFRKLFGYCLEFKVEFAIMFIALLSSLVALQTIDKKYNCSLGTELFGIAFPLLVLHVVFHNTQIPLLTSRIVIGMATAMLVFHLMFFTKKNIIRKSYRET